jgi:transposase
MRARHRLSKLLLRHDVRFDGTAGAWSSRHRDWLGRVDLGRPAQLTMLDYLGAIDALLVRPDTLEGHIERLVPASPWAQTVARLRCLRCIDTLSAVGLCADIGDFARGPVMSFVGLVRCENSSGERRTQGHITKTGSRHARRLLVEAEALAPLRVRGLDRVRPHADLTILAKLACTPPEREPHRSPRKPLRRTLAPQSTPADSS